MESPNLQGKLPFFIIQIYERRRGLSRAGCQETLMCNYNARGHRARATEMTTAMDTLGTGDGGGVSSSTRTPQWVRPLCRCKPQ